MPRFDAIYARQSVDKKDSVSIEAQIDDCRRLCSANPRIYSDRGFSGKNVERPDMQKLIKDIQSGLIKKVVVYKVDRISRNLSDFCNLYDMMKKKGCDFVSSTQPLDTTDPMGEAMLKILFIFAEMERQNTQARIIDNYNYRIKEGCWASGKAPYGFRIEKTDRGVKTLAPIPEEIEVVKWMFKTYAKEPNISLGQIQSKLIEQGFRGHQSKNGFSRTTINHILTNPRERSELTARLDTITKQIADLTRETDNATQFVELAEQYADVKTLDRELLHRLIDRIEIGESYKENGIRHQVVDIFFRFVGRI